MWQELLSEADLVPMFEDQVSTNPLRRHLCTNTRCLTRMLTIRSCVCYAARDLTATYKRTVVQGGGECADTHNAANSTAGLDAEWRRGPVQQVPASAM